MFVHIYLFVKVCGGNSIVCSKHVLEASSKQIKYCNYVRII
jgi:hypothetical protein